MGNEADRLGDEEHVLAEHTSVVLVTDLAGTGELGDDGAEQLRRAHFRLVRELAAASSLTVRSLGDQLLLAFDSAADALAFGAAVQSAAGRRNRRHREHPLEVRVALYPAPPLDDEEVYVSAPVQLARGLCGAAQAGQIVAAEGLREMAGAHPPLPLTDLGPVVILGRTEPIPAVAAAWSRSVATVALPPGLDASMPLVGRHDELEWLAGRWKEASSGNRRLLLVAGEPGSGRTRLAAELARTVHADGGMVLHARPASAGTEPLAVIRRAFDPYLRVCDPATLREHSLAAPHAGPALFPELPWPDSQEGAVAAGVTEIAALVRDVACEAPLLLVVDEIERADAASIAVLQAALEADDAEICVLANYAPSLVAHAGPFASALPSLRRHATDGLLRLRPLDAGAIADMMSGLAPGSSPEDAAAVYERCWGNALVAAQLCRHIGDPDGLPEGLLESVGRRLGRLGPTSGKLLRCAALLGDEADPAAVADMAGLSSAEAAEALAAGEEAGLVRDGKLVHDMVARAIVVAVDSSRGGEEMQEPGRRERVSQAGAEGEPGMEIGSQKPGRSKVKVSEVARRLVARDDAHIRVLDDPPNGSAPNGSATNGKAPNHTAPAAADDETGERRRGVLDALQTRLRGFPDRLDPEKARADLAAAGNVDNVRVRAHLHALRAAVAAVEGRFAPSATEAARAADASDGPGGIATAAVATVVEAWGGWSAGHVHEALGTLERVWSSSDSHDQPAACMLAARTVAAARLGVLDVPGARAALMREMGKPRVRKGSRDRRVLLDTLAVVEALVGRRAEAIRMSSQADLDDARSASKPVLAYCDADLETAERLWTASREARIASGALPAWQADRMLARVLRLRGDADGGRALLEGTLQAVLRGPVVPAELALRSDLALASSAAGELREARSHFIRCLELVSSGEDWHGLGALADVAQAVIELASGRVESAYARFDAGASTLRRLGLPFEEAEALRVWGRALLSAGIKGHGREKLQAAVETYRSCAAGDAWIADATYGPR